MHSTRAPPWTGRRGESRHRSAVVLPLALVLLAVSCAEDAALDAVKCSRKLLKDAACQHAEQNTVGWLGGVTLVSDWHHPCRVTAMVRLEGLVKGGAAGSYEGCFMEHLRILKDPLLDQMVDRCGPAGRQTRETQQKACRTRSQMNCFRAPLQQVARLMPCL
jgi:hypothetical protein